MATGPGLADQAGPVRQQAGPSTRVSWSPREAPFSSLDLTLASGGVQESGEPGRYGPVLAKVREELDEVEEAMKRVEDGSYGRCEACGNTLSNEELDEFPLARRCAACS